MCRSPCSRVAVPSPNPTGGMVWSRRTFAGYNLCVRLFNGYCMGGDMHGSTVDLFQPPGSTALSMGDDHVDVSGDKLSRPSLLRGVGDMETNTRIHGVLAPGAILNLGISPVPLRERVDSPWVSPLVPTF
jgi:hypothetical protein